MNYQEERSLGVREVERCTASYSYKQLTLKRRKANLNLHVTTSDGSETCHSSLNRARPLKRRFRYRGRREARGGRSKWQMNQRQSLYPGAS